MRASRRGTVMWAAGWLLVGACLAGTGLPTTTGRAPTIPVPGSPPTTTSTTAPTTTAATTTTTAPRPARPRGGEAVIGVLGSPATLNPFLEGGESFALGLIGQTIWTGVQDVEPEGLTLIPDVVTQIPRLDNGGLRLNDDGTMSVRYDIRPEAVWADGTPITGSDFEFTYQVVSDGRLPIRPALRDAYRAIIPGSLVVEEKAFEFAVGTPRLDYEFLFNVILPRHQVEGSDFAGAWSESSWVSGGPFQLEGWDREAGRLVVARNQSYWKEDPETGQRLPYLDAVVFRFLEDPVAMFEAFKAGELDIITPPPEPVLVEELLLLEEEGVEVQLRGGPAWEHLNFQFGPGRLDRNADSLTEFRAFRQAVAHLVDRRAIAERVQGGLPLPLESFVPMYWPPASRGAWERYDFDPEQARELLADLGEQLGRDFAAQPPTLVFTTTNEPHRVEVAEMLLPMLAEGGIELQVQLEERAVFFADTVREGEWEMGEWAWVATPGRSGLVEALRQLFFELPPDGLNFYRWQPTGREPEGAARAFEILQGLEGVVDQERLVELVGELERILAEEVVLIPLYAEPNPGAVWASEIAGYRHNPTAAADTWNVELWYRADGSRRRGPARVGEN